MPDPQAGEAEQVARVFITCPHAITAGDSVVANTALASGSTAAPEGTWRGVDPRSGVGRSSCRQEHKDPCLWYQKKPCT